ncbi:MAG: hypothetical protein JRI42_02295 [Deltaproteobacteria bacterium]|nr:hypothetical protein [Deltaproteobacteria bacterium]
MNLANSRIAFLTVFLNFFDGRADQVYLIGSALSSEEAKRENTLEGYNYAYMDYY